MKSIFSRSGAVASRLKQRAEESPLLPIAVFATASLLLISWRPDQWFSPQFGEEDGVVFFSQAATQGWRSLFMPYAGYVHLIPRLIACTTAWLPWEYLPFCYAVAAGSITTAVLTRGAFAGMLLIVRIAAAVGMVAQPRPKRSRNHGSAMGTTVDRSARLPAAIRLPVPAGEFRERAMALARQPCVGRHGFSLTLIFALRQENCGSVPAVEKTEPFLLLVRGQNPSS